METLLQSVQHFACPHSFFETTTSQEQVLQVSRRQKIEGLGIILGIFQALVGIQAPRTRPIKDFSK